MEARCLDSVRSCPNLKPNHPRKQCMYMYIYLKQKKQSIYIYINIGSEKKRERETEQGRESEGEQLGTHISARGTTAYSAFKYGPIVRPDIISPYGATILSPKWSKSVDPYQYWAQWWARTLGPCMAQTVSPYFAPKYRPIKGPTCLFSSISEHHTV
jgi:hypothetical protein